LKTDGRVEEAFGVAKHRPHRTNGSRST
jgi:hypothetical protein